MFYTSFDAPLPDLLFSRYEKCIPLRELEKIRSYRRWEDAHASLLGKLLLIHGLRSWGLEGDISKLSYSSYNRPHLHDAIDFNITHAGKLIVCVMANDLCVGADVEEILPIPLEDFSGQWAMTERLNI